MLKKTLQTLTLIALVSIFASNVYAQNTEVDEILAECEVILDEMAAQRDRAIDLSDKTAQERDEARGQLLFLIPEYETLKRENLHLNVEVEQAPSRWVWFGLGAGAGVATTLLVLWSLQ